MQSVLDRLGGFSQQNSVYNVLGRASVSFSLASLWLTFAPSLQSGQDISGESITGIVPPHELPGSIAEVKCSDLSCKLQEASALGRQGG